MKFHTSVHGENVIIDEGGKLASRKTSFCDGVVFFAKALSIGTRYSILLPNTDESWNGGLRIGLSTKEPSTVQPVPKFTFPELTGRFSRKLDRKIANLARVVLLGSGVRRRVMEFTLSSCFSVVLCVSSERQYQGYSNMSLVFQ